jgi:hypothetical protein
MGTRIRGAVLAFAAALLVAASVPIAWWSGPPVDDGSGKVVEGKSVAIGLLGFEGCRNVGGPEEKCQTRSHTDAKSGLHAGMEFAIAGFATLASALLAAVLLVGQGIAGLTRRQPLRRKLAIGALIASAFVGVAGAAFVILAPGVHGVPRGIGPFVAFGGAALGIVQALLAMRPDREPVPKPVKVPKVKAAKPPKPAKAPKPARPPKGRPELPPIAPPAPPPGGYPPIDFLALMEEDAQQETVPKVPPMPWEQHKQAAPSTALPGPAAVLGTSMPSVSPPPPPPPMPMPMPMPMPVYGGNGGVPITGPNAPTMFPHAAPPPPPPPLPVQTPPPPPMPMPMPMAPIAAPHAPTQAIVPVPSWLPPNPLPSNPMVMPIDGRTPPPGSLPSFVPTPSTPAAEAPTQPPTAIPLPPLFSTAPAATPPAAAGAPPARKTMPPPLRGKPVTQQPPPASNAPPPMVLPIPAAAMAALAKPMSLDADARAGTDVAPALPDNTAPTSAVPEGAEPTDMGPVIDPPPPDDLDGRPDTASDMMETIERSGSEAEAMRTGILRRETPPPFMTVDRSVEDETVPRERPSASQILTSAPKTPTPTPAKAATPAPVKQTPPPQAKTPIPLSTASPDLPPPTEDQAAADGPAPACPQCESPMSWVEKHLRFYCQSCRMYF